MKKCPMCRSKNTIDLKTKELKNIEIDGETYTIYPKNECLSCGSKFNMDIERQDS